MIRFSHRGICVSDLARSAAFYRECFGFEPARDPGILAGPDMETTTELKGVRFAAPTFRVAGGGPTIELLHFLSPEADGSPEPRSYAELGLFHLAFHVADLDATCGRIAELGGRDLRHTRAEMTQPDGSVRRMQYCTDPDGVRIQLLCVPDVPEGFAHSGIVVSDLAASRQYYAALGFTPAGEWRSGPADRMWMAVHTERPGLTLRAQLLRDDDWNAVELLEVGGVRVDPDRRRRPLNRLGLTHLAFFDDEPRATIGRLTERGGHFVEEAHVSLDQVELHHGADPDGVRVELMRSSRRSR
ncbi:hypothetical protein GCM10009609_33570 [Pseudonocardia aurantiaca]|uniref:VOC family protein n=1 Tax=Pseudonocardia aurantiaca TaxID=75290 RepID=A0ABW4FR97_9PSEU